MKIVNGILRTDSSGIEFAAKGSHAAERPNDQLRIKPRVDQDTAWGYYDDNEKWVEGTMPDLYPFFDVWQYCQLAYMIAIKNIHGLLVESGVSGPAFRGFDNKSLDFGINTALSNSGLATARSDMYANMANSAQHIGVTDDAGKGMRISIPVITNFPLLNKLGNHPEFRFATYKEGRPTTSSPENYVQIFQFLEKLFGKNIWDIDRIVSADIPFDVKGLSDWDALDRFFVGHARKGSNIDKTLEQLTKFVTSFKMISPAATIQQKTRKIRNLDQAIAEDANSVSPNAERAANRYKARILRDGLSGVRCFNLIIGLHIRPKTLEYIFGKENPEKSDVYQWAVSNTQAIGLFYKQNPDERKMGKHKESPIQAKKNPKPIWAEQFTALKDIKTVLDQQEPINTRLGIDNLILNVETGMLHVPDVDGVAEDTYQQSGPEFETEEMGWSLSSYGTPIKDVSDDPARGLRNQIRLIDHINHKIIYTTRNATNDVLDLELFTPVNAAHILRYLNSNVESKRMDLNILESVIRSLMSEGEIAGFIENSDLEEAFMNDQQITRPLAKGLAALKADLASGIFNDWQGYFISFAEGVNSTLRYRAVTEDPPEAQNEIFSLGNDPLRALRLKHITPNSTIKVLRPVGRILAEIGRRILSDKDAWMENIDRSVINKMRAMAMAHIFSNYIPNISTIEAQVQTERETLAPSTRPPEEDWKAPAITGANEDFKLLPHQSGIQQKLVGAPKFAILSVDAGGGKCVLGSTLVSTQKGLLTVEEIWNQGEPISRKKKYAWNTANIGVNTLKGRGQAIKVFRRKGKTTKVRLSNGWEWEGLGAHRFWMYNSRTVSMEYRKIKKLAVGDWVPRADSTWHYFPKNEPYLHELDAIREEVDYPVPTHMSPDLAEILGWIVSEGCVAENNIEQHDHEVLNHIQDLMIKIFGVPSYIGSKAPDGIYSEGATTLRYYRFRKVLNTLMGEHAQYSNQKEIPKCIRTATRESQQRFLQALWQGDGSVYEHSQKYKDDKTSVDNRWELEYGTVSDTLAQQLAHVLDHFGLKAHIRKCRDYVSAQGTKDKRTIWQIRIDKYQIKEFQERIGFLDVGTISKKVHKLEEAVAHYSNVYESGNYQNSNAETMGERNRLPSGPLFYLHELLEEIIDETHPREWRNRETDTNGGYFIRTSSPWYDAEKTSNRSMRMSITWRYRKEHTTRLTVEKWLDVFKHLPVDIQNRAHQNKKFRKAFKFLHHILKYEGWIQISNIEKGSMQTVYDLNVPKHENYVATGIYQHNTATALYKSIEMMDKSKVKKVLILCPSYLVRNYIQDNIKLTGGKWNIFPLIRQTTQEATSYDIIEKTFAQAHKAPRNTIFVSDYNFAKQGNYQISYLDQRVQGFRNAELLLELGFDMIICDESHFLKTAGTARTMAMRRLLGSAKYRYLMSGTVVDRNMSDLHTQVALLDPTLLGKEEDFYNKYAEDWEAVGNRVEVRVWKSNWASLIRQDLGDSVAYVQVKKREWAALLPHKVETFHPVELSTEQMKVYEAVLKAIAESADVQKRIAQARRYAKENPDEEQGDNIDMLARHLQRLEKMMTAPGKDPLGKGLDPEDWVSPKVTKIIELCEDHLSRKVPGKILILTNFKDSRDAIYENMPKKLQRKTLRYIAEQKEAQIPQFENDDSIQIMVGIQKSLEVGYNLQFVSRLIRVESVWNPGSLEQGESRLFRPDVESKYPMPMEDDGDGNKRAVKYVDWINASRTIDVTKTARLIARMIQKVKWDEADNPNSEMRGRYLNLEEVELKSMSFESIFNNNDFEAELSEHINVYGQYMRIRIDDYETYKKDSGTLKNVVPIPSEKMDKKDRFILDMPYIEGQSLPEESKFGIQTVQEWASEQGIIAFLDDSYDDAPDDDEPDEDAEEKQLSATLRDVDLRGYMVHTQWGPGLVVRSSFAKTGKSKFEVMYRDNYSDKGWSTASLAKGAVFVYKDQKPLELPRGGSKVMATQSPSIYYGKDTK